jgi:ubiquinone/menaquinone biosynthesis C-methylase UbiE
VDTAAVRCPECSHALAGFQEALHRENGETWLVCPQCDARRSVTDDDQLVHIITKKDVKARYPEMELQTRFGAKFYDALEQDFAEIIQMEPDAIRREYLGSIAWPPTARILDVGVGTGSELEFLCREHPDACRTWTICGIDISIEMLRIAMKKIRRQQLHGLLFVGFAEQLPFSDDSFDIVFHTGSINEFHDQGRAIREMIRVVKPGGRILITDEWMTAENVQQPIGKELARMFPSITVPTPTPFEAVPRELVDEERMTTLWGGYGYSIRLRKSAASEATSAE